VTKAKLATAVQTSLNKADSALQEAPVTSVNGHTGDVVIDTATGSSVGDATTSAKGLVKLGGDLAGTAAAPTVPKLAEKVDKITNELALAAKADLGEDGMIPWAQARNPVLWLESLPSVDLTGTQDMRTVMPGVLEQAAADRKKIMNAKGRLATSGLIDVYGGQDWECVLAPPPWGYKGEPPFAIVPWKDPQTGIQPAFQGASMLAYRSRPCGEALGQRTRRSSRTSSSTASPRPTVRASSTTSTASSARVRSSAYRPKTC
jgi:hypothetical protein